ncbi:hypothetical protein ACFVR2_15910 [Gottfriedia sp. NPDC057991]
MKHYAAIDLGGSAIKFALINIIYQIQVRPIKNKLKSLKYNKFR